MARTYRPLRLRTESVRPTGPRQFNWDKTEVKLVGGPGDPPPGFVGGQNSESEWIWYWASFKATSPELDPRQPPFFGNSTFGYQKAQLGSHTRALGSAVADFLYRLATELLIVRLQSSYFHLMAPAGKQAIDAIQLTNLLGMQAGVYIANVVDIYESSFMGPGTETGEAAVVLCKETLGLIRRVDPLTAGVARIVRNPAKSLD